MSVTTTTTTTKATTTTIAAPSSKDDAQSLSSSASSSPVSRTVSSPTTPQSSAQLLSPILINNEPGSLFDESKSGVSTSAADMAADIGSVTGSVTSVLHKKDSGTSMATSAAEASQEDNVSGYSDGGGCAKKDTSSSRRLAYSDAAVYSSATVAPTGRVLSRPLSTSKLSATPTVAPHILPMPRHHAAGFNLATLGQLSPSASTAASGGTMTLSRSDTLAFLSSNANNSYFTLHGGSSASSRANNYYGDISGAVPGVSGVFGGDMGTASKAEGIVLPLPAGNRTTMCGSDAISLLDLEDTHNDLVMIDSNGNSSGSGVTGAAVVGETIASASAIVANGPSSSSHGVTGTLSASSAALLGGVVGSGHLSGLQTSSTTASGSTASSVSSSGPRSSLPSLTSQAKRDAMQRAAMLAAMQQNGGAKVLAAHRVGRRQDRPSRNIRFGDFHRICEIEYGFDQGKAKDAQQKREEMLYLFSDVLVTGTKIEKGTADNVTARAGDTERRHEVESDKCSFVDEGRNEEQTRDKETRNSSDSEHDDTTVISKEDVLNNPNKFITLLNETTVAHKHHLLFQSKYLADLKRFKRHSAFSFDTSFLKTWGIPGGLNIGSIKSSSSGGHGTIHYPGNGTNGPNGQFTASPVTSPGGGAFDPYQYQQFLNLNRPQSMAGSLFNFALNGGAFPSFSSGDHSKENSYATLRGTNAANALQYHHQQQQMLQQQLHNRLSMTSTSSGVAGHSSGRTGIDRTSSASAFDALWFMKGSGVDPVRSRRSAMDAVSSTPIQATNEDKEKHAEDDFTDVGSGASSIHSSSSNTNLAILTATASSGGHTVHAASGHQGSINPSASRPSSISGFSLLPSPISPTGPHNNAVGTLRNGAGWVKDEHATVCMVCSITKFGVLVRKHHCRLCGRVICWKCCQMKEVVLSAEGAGVGAVPAPQELRKPIRVCLDCIEQDTVQEQQQQQRMTSQPISFPMQGVFGRLISSTSTSPQLTTSATNATGSTFAMPHHPHITSQGPVHPQVPFHPRAVGYNRSGHAYPHHHRASMYRIDVERVGEEDEEEEGQQEQGQEETGAIHESTTKEKTSAESTSKAQYEDMKSMIQPGRGTQSSHSTLRLKDLSPEDINEDEVNTQIMTLESEVESLLIQNAPLMFSAGASSQNARTGNSAAGKTRVIRGIPKELLQSVSGAVEDESGGEDEEEEEKTMEELLAEQNDQIQHAMAR
ncbi:hypothetical protein EDD11_004187 [Mortierella claussenii]|nr:hypothetical protein EDD11_004187 [Mortierella claussenii]